MKFISWLQDLLSYRYSVINPRRLLRLTTRWYEMVNISNKLKAQKCFFQEAYLGSYPYNLIKSGNLKKYYKTLTDFKL